jgi:glutamate racemase
MSNEKNLSPSFTLPQKIGMLDSGVGGLSILNALIPFLPSQTVYVADAAHLPYGQKTPEFLIDRATAITRFFESQGITTIFVACHTLSATAVAPLKILFPHITYVDLLPLTVTRALASTKNNRIGVMATPATIATHIHKKSILASTDLETTIIEQACPDFVPLVERKASPQECKAAIATYLTPLLAAEVDTIILGCTHYPFIQPLLEKQTPHITFISAANALPSFPTKVDHSTIEFVTTASLDYIIQAVDHFFSKEHGSHIIFTSQTDL